MKNINVQILNLPPKEILLSAIQKPYNTKNPSFETVKNVIKLLKHGSVAEHVFINFDITGISRLCLQELARHRHASLTVQSTRFTLDKMLIKEKISGGDLEEYFVTPFYKEDEWDCLEDYNEYISSLKSSWFVDVERMKLFKKTINLSNDFLKYFIPEALRVNLTWSINIRSLQNFLTLRLNKTAHFEIRYLANLILNSIKNTYVYELIDI